YFLYDSLPKDEVSDALINDISQAVEANEGVTFDEVSLDITGEQPVYTVTLLSTHQAYAFDLSDELDTLIESATGEVCRVRVITHRLNVSD
ncbi:MAG: hypothetical protein AB8C95_11300, partial [Phycisphaeraceae bacterium]